MKTMNSCYRYVLFHTEEQHFHLCPLSSCLLSILSTDYHSERVADSRCLHVSQLLWLEGSPTLPSSRRLRRVCFTFAKGRWRADRGGRRMTPRASTRDYEKGFGERFRSRRVSRFREFLCDDGSDLVFPPKWCVFGPAQAINLTVMPVYARPPFMNVFAYVIVRSF
jgi:hypothetical protein